MKNQCIYKITNPNNRIYIGKTGHYLQRMNAYANGHMKDQPKLYNSVMKHGWDNHTKEKIFDGIVESNGEINKLEQYFVRLFDSKKNGLNCTDGGDGIYGCHIVGRPHTEEFKKRMSLKRKEWWRKTKQDKEKYAQIRKTFSEVKKGIPGKKRTDDQKLKMSKKMTGKGNPMYGIRGKNNPNYGSKRSEETKAKMRQIWAERKSKKNE